MAQYTSPWARPIVLVSKQEGTTYQALCGINGHLNAIMKLEEFPLPYLDDSLDIANASST